MIRGYQIEVNWTLQLIIGQFFVGHVEMLHQAC